TTGGIMRILAVEQHEQASLGVVGETLETLGVEIDTMWGARGDTLPRDHREHDGIVVLGGSMTALDDERCPYFPGLTRLIREFAEAGKPVLGICLGSQLVARAFDARLRIGGELELGFHPVAPTAAAADDPVFRELASPLPLLQWHTDHYELPPGAELLATGERYPNQAYRIDGTVYATQFHFEVSESLVQTWVDLSPELDELAPGSRQWLPAQAAEHVAASADFCRAVTRRWAALG
ncbi:MAG TPA: type 1 glutamine amidotransferase, partial [Arenicellales bacterium]|nr:type 1 glutamine amidotransferase [Arenicellales bacterium]